MCVCVCVHCWVGVGRKEKDNSKIFNLCFAGLEREHKEIWHVRSLLDFHFCSEIVTLYLSPNISQLQVDVRP